MSARFTLLGLMMLGALSVSRAVAQIPADQTIHWSFRENPEDPESTVEIHAIVTLSAVEVDEENVGWSVASVEFIRGEGEDETSWVEVAPPLETPDGLWWVAHADVENPQLDEFIDTPLLSGRAYSDDPEEVDLLYEIESATPMEGGPFEQTSGVSYLLAAADTNEPVKEGEQEPVETVDTRSIE